MRFSDCGIFGFMAAIIFSILGVAFVMPFSSEEMPGVPDETSVEQVVSQPALVIFENVATRGGLEVFPEPDRSSGRLFAASANFAPYVAGINAEGNWLFLIYFDNGAMVTGWSPLSQIVLTEEEIASLVVVDAQNLPSLPTELSGDLTSASRPYGVNSSGNPEPTDTPEPSGGGSGGGGSSGGGGGGGNPSPTSPPPPAPTNTPGPVQTEEPTEV